MIGQERAKARARLEARIPFPRAGILVPRHVADVIDGRELGPRRDIGHRKRFTRKPIPAIREVADIVEMLVDVLKSGPYGAGARFAAAKEALDQFFADEI